MMVGVRGSESSHGKQRETWVGSRREGNLHRLDSGDLLIREFSILRNSGFMLKSDTLRKCRNLGNGSPFLYSLSQPVLCFSF